jgi:DNA repair photolyase
MNFDIIKATTGKASEYAPYVVELYEKRNGKTEQVENALNRLIKDAAFLKENKFKDEILLCFETDPYPPDDECHTITREAIKILDDNKLKYVIRTENDNTIRAISDCDQLKRPENTKLIIKITSIPHDKKNERQADEYCMDLMFSSLFYAFEKGVKIWIDLNPGVVLSE